MAIIAYRPELENPPREGSIGFAYKPEGSRRIESLTLNPGLNREISDSDWELVKTMPKVKALVKIGAVEEFKAADLEAKEKAAKVQDLSEVMGLSIPSALKVIEVCSDEEFLSKWKLADGRSTVTARINASLTALQEGKR
jgi:hypothetical protein